MAIRCVSIAARSGSLPSRGQQHGADADRAVGIDRRHQRLDAFAALRAPWRKPSPNRWRIRSGRWPAPRSVPHSRAQRRTPPSCRAPWCRRRVSSASPGTVLPAPGSATMPMRNVPISSRQSARAGPHQSAPCTTMRAVHAFSAAFMRNDASSPFYSIRAHYRAKPLPFGFRIANAAAEPYVWAVQTGNNDPDGARLPLRPGFLRHRRRRRRRALRRRRRQHVRPYRRGLRRRARATATGLRSGPLLLPNMASLGLGQAAETATGLRLRRLGDGSARHRPSTARRRKCRAARTRRPAIGRSPAVPVPLRLGLFPGHGSRLSGRTDRGDHPRRRGCRAFSATAMRRAPRSSSGSARSTSAPASRSATPPPIRSSRSPRMKPHFGLERLYELCQVVRRLVDPLNIGRVIARPFVGETAATFQRTAQPPRLRRAAAGADPARPADGARQHASSPSARSATSSPIAASREVRKAAGNMALFDKALGAMDDAGDGDLVFANFVDFDTEFGHRRDVAGYAAALEAFDRRLPEALAKLRPGDLLHPHRRPRLRSDLARHRPYARARSGHRHWTPGCRAATSACARPSPISARPSPSISAWRAAATAPPSMQTIGGHA